MGLTLVVSAAAPVIVPCLPPPLRPPPIAILIAITAIGPLALNIFLPSLPGLVRVFDTDYGTAQLALTLYLVGIACGQLIYGPLSDRFGRRPVLLAGLGVFVIGSLLAALAPSIGLLIAGRVVQAVGGCAGMVLGRAIVRDVYERDKAASTLAYITMAMAVAPALAPAIGGFLDVWFGWQASFLFVLAFGAVVWFWCLASARETNFQRQPLPGLRGMAAGYRELLRSRVFLGYALNTAFTTAVFFAFLAGAPYIMIELLKRPASEYGTLFILVSIGYALGNFIAARLAVKVGARRLVLAGSLVNLAGVLVMGALGLAGEFSALGDLPAHVHRRGRQRARHAQRHRGGDQRQSATGRLGIRSAGLPSDVGRRRLHGGGGVPEGRRSDGDGRGDDDRGAAVADGLWTGCQRPGACGWNGARAGNDRLESG